MNQTIWRFIKIVEILNQISMAHDNNNVSICLESPNFKISVQIP